jgi:uncharacterized membrane protein
MDDVTIARAIHVVAIVHWMGGVAFVTTVILPALSANAEPARPVALLESVERRFSAQVRVSVPLAGLSGAYLAERLDIWARFVAPEGWWLMAMAIVWLVFMAMLFVIEPLLHPRFHRWAMADAAGAFSIARRAHWGLLALGTATAAAAVLGAHGLLG